MQVERFERDGEIIEVRDGREFHFTLVEYGVKLRHQHGPYVDVGRSVILHRRGGRTTPEREDYRAKGEGRYRSEAYKLRTLGRDRRCRWCGCDLPAGTDALVRWREGKQSYSYVCFDCGDKRG